MGTISYVACKTCKVYRDLDKFYGIPEVDTRKEALEYAERLKEDSFRAALLVTFMREHAEHDCVFFTEHAGIYEDISYGTERSEWREQSNQFWTEDGNEDL